MRHVTSGGLIAAALGTALFVAGAFPASAQVGRFQPAFAGGHSDGDLLTLVREGGGGGGGSGGGGEGGDRGGGRADRSAGGGGAILVERNRDRGDRIAHGDRGDRVTMRADRRSNVARNARAESRVVRRDRDDRRRRVIVRRFFPQTFGFGSHSYGDYGYCLSQFQAYDPASGLYLSYDGQWYSCP